MRDRDDSPANDATAELLERGRTAYTARAWGDAYAALRAAGESTSLGLDDLERLAWAAGLTARDDEYLESMERAYHVARDDGAPDRAVQAAYWGAMRLLGLGESGRAGAWFARAGKIVEEELGDCVWQGYLEVPKAMRCQMGGAFDEADAAAERAITIGERFGDSSVVTLAKYVRGCALIRRGDVERGLSYLDQAMLSATDESPYPIVAGLVYCGVISHCQKVFAFERSREWTQALERWCSSQPQLVPFSGTCLVHRAEIFQLEGAWDEAMEETERIDRLGQDRDAMEAKAAAAYQRAEVRRLRGELDAAEKAYKQSSQLGQDPQPGLALLRMAQGNPDAAAQALRRILASTPDALARTRYLPAMVEILLAAGELDEARAACAELEGIAEAFDTDVLEAIAAHARGAVRLADGDPEGAVTPLRKAFVTWRDLGAPYIAARIRVLLGRAFEALGDDDGAALEREAAREIFERLGATPDLERLAQGTGPLPPRSSRAPSARSSAPPGEHGLTSRELEVLRLLASGKTNKEIAAELSISAKTVDRHLSNIFGKLEVTTRAAATAFAYQNGLA